MPRLPFQEIQACRGRWVPFPGLASWRGICVTYLAVFRRCWRGVGALFRYAGLLQATATYFFTLF